MKQLEIGQRCEVYRVNNCSRYWPDQIKAGDFRIGKTIEGLPLISLTHCEYDGHGWALGTSESIFENEVTHVAALVIKQLKNI